MTLQLDCGKCNHKFQCLTERKDNGFVFCKISGQYYNENGERAFGKVISDMDSDGYVTIKVYDASDNLRIKLGKCI